MDYLSAIVLIVLGLAIAFLGRKLLWLVIAAAGFVIAFQITHRFFDGANELLALIISLGVGVVAGYYATKFSRLLINIAGFILIGNAAMTVFGWFVNLDENVLMAVIVFAAAGIIGLGLIRMMFALAVIIISALGGTSMVTEGLAWLTPASDIDVGFFNQPWVSAVIGFVVVVAGAFFQYRAWKAEPERD